MSKIAVVYWSGTGNTEQMANAVAEGAKEAGAEVSTLTADQFSAAKVAEFDAIAFGCPAMGAETLEEDEFEPMFTGCESALSGKKLALFGSYGWGDGEWMRTWEDDCRPASSAAKRPTTRRWKTAASLAQSWQNKIVPGIPGTQFPFLFVCRGFFVPFD